MTPSGTREKQRLFLSQVCEYVWRILAPKFVIKSKGKKIPDGTLDDDDIAIDDDDNPAVVDIRDEEENEDFFVAFFLFPEERAILFSGGSCFSACESYRVVVFNDRRRCCASDADACERYHRALRSGASRRLAHVWRGSVAGRTDAHHEGKREGRLGSDASCAASER